MKIIIAPDSFKESLSATKVCEAIEDGFKIIYPNATFLKIPIADGGEGTVETLIKSIGGKLVKCEVLFPLRNKGYAQYGVLDNQAAKNTTAVIELAKSSGLTLVSVTDRNPEKTTTYGFGQMIKHALDLGIRNFILALGGSATNDCGSGMLQALGAVFLDLNNQPINPCGGNLNKISKINLCDFDERLNESTFNIACDVTNPLCGDNGASFIFGAQKGASIEQMIKLDMNLQHFADIVEKISNKSSQFIPGSGAAGGTGFSILAFFNAKLISGAEFILDTINFNQTLNSASLVITGEGKMDSQSIFGKAPIEVAKISKRKNIPVIAIVGSLAKNYECVYRYGIDAVFPCIQRIDTFENTIADAYENIKLTSYNIAKLWSLHPK